MISFLTAAVVASVPVSEAFQRTDTVAIRVNVAREGQPIAGARVRMSQVELVTATAGSVSFRLARSSEYQLTVSAIGFRPYSLAVVLAPGVLDTTLTVELEAEAAQVEELIVESTRSSRRVEEQPLRVEVLAREEIEEKLLMTPGDITMMLNETGGLRVQTTSPSLGGANVRVQGLRGRYTLLLADGLPLYGGQAGGLGLLQVPPMDLGQVEIIKGASSALYGSSALGGVINLISRRPPLAGTERELLLNGTTLGGTDAVFWTAGHLGGLGYSLLGGGHRQGRKDRDDDGWTDVPGYERLVLRPRAHWSRPSGGSLFLTAGTTIESRDGGTLEGEVAPDGSPFLESLRTTRVDGGARLLWPLSGEAVLAVRASAMTQGHRHRFGETGEPDRHTTWFTEASISRDIGRSVVVIGAALQGERYRSDGFPEFDYDFTVPGGFVHGEIVASDRVALALSGRLDHHSEYGTRLNPRVSLLLSPASGLSARLSAGSGYHAPTPFTEETEVTGLSRLAPLEGLEVERATGGSLDLQAVRGGLELNATFFGSVVDDAVQLLEGDDGARLINASGPTRTWGVDLVGRFRREALGITTSYTYTRATEPDPVTQVRRPVPLTPRHTAGLVAVHEREARSRFGIEVYYTGRQALDDQTYRATSRPYLIVGALGQVQFGAVKVFLNLENLGGVRQTRYVPLVRPERAADGRWTTDVWAPLDGRVFNGGVRWTF